jgi:hypothetical protein
MIKKTPLKKIWKKRRERIDNWGSEVLTFKEVIKRAERYNAPYPISELSWISIQHSFEDLPSRCFAHLLNKKNYPKFRNNPNNIILVANPEEHEAVDRVMCIPWVKREVEEMLEAGKSTIIAYISELYLKQQAGLN